MLRKFLTVLLLAMLPIASVQAATLFTANACLSLPTPGDPASQNSWGTLLNNNSKILDGLVSTVTSIGVGGSSNVVLTFNCGIVDQTQAAHFIFTGALTGNITVFWPNSRNRVFSVSNTTSGSYTLTLAVNNGSGSAAGTTIAMPQGYTGEFYDDGTNIVSRVTSGAITGGANTVVGNITGSTTQDLDIPIPTCAGGLTYNPGSGFGCNAGGGGGGGGGTGLSWGGVQTAAFNAAVNTIYCVDTTLGTITMTLPSSPMPGNLIVFTDCNGTFALNPLTVAANGQNIMSLNQNMVVSTANAGSTMVYSGSAYGWRMY